jgi:transforming growth factor-beta-induced protein
MKNRKFTIGIRKSALIVAVAFSSLGASAQTNVFDNVIVPSPNHTSLELAIASVPAIQSALQDPSANLTVFAPDDAAFADLATALNTDVAGLLALPNLADILSYHVLGTEVPAAGVTNGAVVQPLSMTNTLKLTLTSTGDVFVNQAQVTAPDLPSDNGVVHSINAALLPFETVADIAIDNNFTTLVTAVATAELLPALTNPFATLTVFAPDNAAFDDLATALTTDINGLLALPNLADILTYHVLGTTVPSSGVTNGAVVQPLSMTNTLKLTVTGSGDVFVNQAQVNLVDLDATNGTVHTLNAVVLPFETVADIAIDNNFTTLVTAVATAELLPALTNPFATLTVFAPDNAAFDDVASALGTDINGLLALPNLADILLYHVVGSTVLSGDLMNGSVTMLSGQDVQVDLSSGVMINSSEVVLADLTAANGVVHTIDAVLLASAVGIEENDQGSISIYPNPSSDYVTLEIENGEYSNVTLYNSQGQKTLAQNISNDKTQIAVNTLTPGQYIISLEGESGAIRKSLLITNNK